MFDCVGVERHEEDESLLVLYPLQRADIETLGVYVYMCGGLCVHSVRCQSRAQKNVAALFFEILQSSNFIIIKFFLGAIKTVVCFVELGLGKPD